MHLKFVKIETRTQKTKDKNLESGKKTFEQY